MRKRLLLFFLFSAYMTNASVCQAAINEDTTTVVLKPFQDIIPDDGSEVHRNQPLCIGLLNHTMVFYTDYEKQVRIFPVNYDDQTTPLYTTYVPENTYSCVLPSWLVGVYAIEIEINGIIFIGEIEI